VKKRKAECRTCRWAEWKRTPTGRISQVSAGHCRCPVSWPLLPACMDVPRERRRGIWTDEGKDCVRWQPTI